EINIEDALLIAEAASNSQQIASKILKDEAAPGALVTIMSPELLDTEGTFSIEVGNSNYVQQPPRVVRGYATFMVPLDPITPGTLAVTPGPVEVRLLQDGIVVDTYTLNILEPETLPENPREELIRIIDYLINSTAEYQSLADEALKARNLEQESYETLNYLISIAKDDASNRLADMKAYLQEEGGEELSKLFLLIANANGLSDALSNKSFQNEKCLVEGYMESATSIDYTLSEICRIQKALKAVNFAFDAIIIGCNGILALAIAATVSPFDGIAGETILFIKWAGTCSQIELAIDTIKVVTDFFSSIDPDLQLKASTVFPHPYQPVTLSSTIEILGFDDICNLGINSGLNRLFKKFAKKSVNNLIKRKLVLKGFVKILEGVSDTGYHILLDSLKNVATTLLSQLRPMFEGLLKEQCNFLDGLEHSIDVKDVLSGPNPQLGDIFFIDDKTAEYLCPDCSDAATCNMPLPLISFTAKKNICGKEEQTEPVLIQCNTQTIACFSMSSTAKTLSPVLLNSSCSSSSDEIIEYTWSASNGWGESTTRRYNLVFFSEPGTYTVTLAIKDEKGNTDTTSKVITIEDPDDCKTNPNIDCPDDCETNPDIDCPDDCETNPDIDCPDDCETNPDIDCPDDCETNLSIDCPDHPNNIDNPKKGDSSGEPHLYTFDGLKYDFQVVGEFLCLQSTQDPTEMTIQIRQGPWRDSKHIAANKAVAMNVGGDIVEINVENTPRLSINNAPVTMAAKEVKQLKNGCKIYAETQRKYWIIWKDNSMAEVRTYNSHLDISVSLPDNRKGLVRGLLGNSDGDKTNDLQTRDGSTIFDISTELTKDELYNQFSNSWRITQAESLFTYAEGENTATYTDLNFPYELVKASDLSETVQANAEQTCRDAGITDPILLEDCILDVGMTGDATFADNMTDLTPPEQSITVTDDWLLYGDAQKIEGEKIIRITPDAAWQTGMALREGALNLDGSFEKTFNIYMGDNDNGADGMVFVMLPELPPAGTSLNGGEGLGFSSACNNKPCLGVEIDTYRNSSDPSEDHIALIRNGSVRHNSTENQPLPVVPLSANIEDGEIHSLTIRWQKEDLV
ncbi:MAG: hypothetical protein D3905_11735, partial [Candidatus Electrothrix sp. AS4_5]|nr:hypothetical protein [Candidatus Electrothrix gigas]